jgi:nicotinamidase/pyrazinamidase
MVFGLGKTMTEDKPMSDRMLIVVDMLEDFCNPEGKLFCGPGVAEIIPVIVQKQREYLDQGQPVIHICDHHDPDDLEFERFPEHCVEGSPGAQIIPQLQDDRIIVVPKKRYSGFFGTNLDEIIAEHQPKQVELVGLCTNICVFFTAEELRNRDIPTVVERRAVTSFDPEAHENALKQMAEILQVDVR